VVVATKLGVFDALADAPAEAATIATLLRVHAGALAKLLNLLVAGAKLALGTVTEVTAHGAHPLLRVAPPAGSERMIPYVPAIVLQVDVDAGRIEVDWGESY
jgi:hypothetical protein